MFVTQSGDEEILIKEDGHPHSINTECPTQQIDIQQKGKGSRYLDVRTVLQEDDQNTDEQEVITIMGGYEDMADIRQDGMHEVREDRHAINIAVIAGAEVADIKYQLIIDAKY